MNILITELGGSHIEVIYTLVHLLTQKGHKVYLMCNEGLNELIKEKECIEEIYLVPDEIKTVKKQFNVLKKIKLVVKEKKIDTIIFGTIEIKPVRNILLFLPRVNIVGILHNALKLEKSSTFKYIYSLRINKYLILGNFVKNSIHNFPKEQLYSFYPIYFPKPANDSLLKTEGEVWVIVPGVVKSERKDYIPLLKTIAEKNLPDNMKLVFLGKFYNEETEIKSLIKKINTTTNQVVIFDDYIEYDTFHNYLAKADFILPLLKISDDAFYGNSRISGAFNLAYSYRLPLLLPASYKKNTDLTEYSIYYETMDGLYDILFSISNKQIEEKQIRQAYELNDKFNFDKMADSLISFIQKQ